MNNAQASLLTMKHGCMVVTEPTHVADWRWELGGWVTFDETYNLLIVGLISDC